MCEFNFPLVIRNSDLPHYTKKVVKDCLISQDIYATRNIRGVTVSLVAVSSQQSIDDPQSSTYNSINIGTSYQIKCIFAIRYIVDSGIMEVTKSTTAFASRLIVMALSCLVIIHQVKRIDAFQLNPVQSNQYSSKSTNICCKVCPSNQMSRFLSATDQGDETVAVIDSRRRFLAQSASILLSSSASWMMTMAQPVIVHAAGELPDQFNVDDYLKSGMVMNPMGVSGQAGKSKPVTGM